MALECGFQKKVCDEKCALYVKGRKECAIMSMTVLLEGLHNMGVLAHDKWIKEDPYENFNEDALAKALMDEEEIDDKKTDTKK
ncbi:MAG TPA: hypothetical protein PL110_14435 [Candidatus Eremiobacteraeota bacterium]|nr:MAG: hypothetical protein BWY64_01571 [bacterium ADurb.Bin363]HPZ09303.1 hypothetical protein [Candidatus Eremiobacteraeota bacterium]